MADNTTLNSGTGGDVIATDDIGPGVKYQRVKVTLGADGVNDGDISSANPMPVDGSGVTQPVSAASLPLPTGASTAANQTTIIGHVDGIEALLTTIDADTSSVAGAVAGTEMQVDVVASLPAGTNAIGKLAANSGVDIGDVDVTSVPQPTSHYRNIDANAEAAIKGSAGTLYWIHAINLTAAVAYLHLYDATTANVTPGTTTPDFTFPIPTQGDTNGAGFNLSFGPGQSFANAITLVVTTTNDGSAGDPGTNGVMVNAGYA